VAVGLGQDQGDATQRRGQAGRAGDEAAAAHHHVGLPLAQNLARGADRGQRLQPGPGGAQRVAAVEPADLDEVDLITGGGDQLRLFALAGADEADLGAAGAQLVSDRDRGDDVSRGTARCTSSSSATPRISMV